MSDFIFRLFCRWHHNLIVSNCCNNGLSLPKEVYDPSASPGTPTSEENDVYYDAQSSHNSTQT